MFKISGNAEKFSIKIYEDKFTDESILRTEIIIHDNEEQDHQEKFENCIEKLKAVVNKENNKLNTYSIMLELLNIEKDRLDNSEHKRNISPMEIFPKYSLVRDFGDGRLEYKGEKIISWETFIKFINNLN